LRNRLRSTARRTGCPGRTEKGSKNPVGQRMGCYAKGACVTLLKTASFKSSRKPPHSPYGLPERIGVNLSPHNKTAPHNGWKNKPTVDTEPKFCHPAQVPKRLCLKFRLI
jgi:hypothetical protein